MIRRMEMVSHFKGLFLPAGSPGHKPLRLAGAWLITFYNLQLCQSVHHRREEIKAFLRAVKGNRLFLDLRISRQG